MTSSLRVPFCVHIASVLPADVELLLDCLENELGGQYFRTRDLFLQVLGDRQRQASVPPNFLSGPYIRLTPIQNEVLRITSVDTVPGGDTVYAFDQVMDALIALEPAPTVSPTRPRG